MQHQQNLIIFSQGNGQKPRFVPILSLLGPILAGDIFCQKSGFITVRDLLKANFMQKNQKNLMVGSMRTFVTDRQTDRLTEVSPNKLKGQRTL